jgi:hypothetical protein
MRHDETERVFEVAMLRSNFAAVGAASIPVSGFWRVSPSRILLADRLAAIRSLHSDCRRVPTLRTGGNSLDM